MESQKIAINPKPINIFPLGVVLLPEMTMPLHIFEERYKIMINECLEKNEPFGIVYFDGQQIRRIGCMAHIIEISKQYDDGRMDIVVRGGQRFYMSQVDDSCPCLMADIFTFEDTEESVYNGEETLFHNAADLLKKLDRLTGRSQDNEVFDAVDHKRLSFLIPAAQGFTMEERQRFLEMTSARERMEKGARVLEKVIARVKINVEVERIIGNNGHVRAFLADKGLAT
jgi:Lon protease-like protein